MKLQQKIAMGLCAFYLVTVIGIAMNMHFCSCKLSSVKFTEPATCGACKGDNKEQKRHDCCKDTAVDVKVKDSHEAGFKVKLPQNFSVELFLGPIFTERVNGVLKKLFKRAENKAPPISALLSLHIYNCVFRN